DTKYDTILKPAKPRGPVEDATILGFDTEFTPAGNLLSIQLAAPSGGKLVSEVRYTSNMDKNDLVDHVANFCHNTGVALSDYIVLVAHFASAEISHINNFMSDFHLQTFNKALEG